MEGIGRGIDKNGDDSDEELSWLGYVRMKGGGIITDNSGYYSIFFY